MPERHWSGLARCPACGSWNVDVFGIPADDGGDKWHGECNDCPTCFDPTESVGVPAVAKASSSDDRPRAIRDDST